MYHFSCLPRIALCKVYGEQGLWMFPCKCFLRPNCLGARSVSVRMGNEMLRI